MILNDFSKRYKIITPENLNKTTDGFIVTPHCFNFIGQRFPISHQHVVFWDGNKFYSGARIVHIEEVE